MALIFPQLPIENFDEQVPLAHQPATVSDGEEANSSEHDEEELALILSQLPIDDFDEQVTLLAQPTMTTTTVGDEVSLLSLPRVEVWINHPRSFSRIKHLPG